MTDRANRFSWDDEDVLHLQINPPPSKKPEVAKLHTVKKTESDEWFVYDADGEVVGEWDTKKEATDHAATLDKLAAIK